MHSGCGSTWQKVTIPVPVLTPQQYFSFRVHTYLVSLRLLLGTVICRIMLWTFELWLDRFHLEQYGILIEVFYRSYFTFFCFVNTTSWNWVTR
jgi:hypothetical protein